LFPQNHILFYTISTIILLFLLFCLPFCNFLIFVSFISLWFLSFALHTPKKCCQLWSAQQCYPFYSVNSTDLSNSLLHLNFNIFVFKIFVTNLHLLLKDYNLIFRFVLFGILKIYVYMHMYMYVYVDYMYSVYIYIYVGVIVQGKREASLLIID